MTAVTSTGTLLADVMSEVRSALSEAGLGLQSMDRLDLRSYTDQHLDRGFVVRAPRTTNSGQYRDTHLARVLDAIEVDVSYRIAPTRQVETFEEATVLEEQVRRVVTSRRTAWGERMTYETSERIFQGEDSSWLIITQTYSTRRNALMGG